MIKIDDDKKINIINAFMHRQINRSLIDLVETIAKTYDENVLVVIRIIFNFDVFTELYSEEDIKSFKDRYFQFAYELQRIGTKTDSLIDDINMVSSHSNNISLSASRKVQKQIKKIKYYSEIYQFYKNFIVFKEHIPSLYKKHSDLIMKLVDKNINREYKEYLLENLDTIDLLNISKVILCYFESYNLKQYADDLKEVTNIVMNIYNKKIEQKNSTMEDKKQFLTKEKNTYSSETYIQYYLDSGMIKIEWINRFKIPSSIFSDHVRNVKKSNPKLYERYIRYQKEEEKLLIKLAETISYYYENGIVVGENEKRKFTILDYYFITSIHLNTFLKAIKGLKIDAKTLVNVKCFCTTYSNSTSINERNISNLNFYKNFGSEKRNLLPDEVREIVSFFKENDIPLEDTTYLAFINEYAACRILLPTHNNK